MGEDRAIRLGALISCRRDEQDDAAVFGEALRLASEAERLGYDSVWVNEHHFVDSGRCPAPLTMASFILGRTSTIRVGTAVVLLPLHNPLEVAEQASLIDLLSGGRLDLGLGKCGYTRDLAAFDVLPSDLDRRYEQDLEILSDTLDKGALAVGRSVRWDPPLPLAPALRPGARIPRYLATGNPATVEWAARHGCGLLLPYTEGFERKAQLVDMHRGAGQRDGPNVGAVDHVAVALGQVADTRSEARALVRDAGASWLRSGLTDLGHRSLRAVPAYHARLVEEVGRYQEAEPHIDRMIDAGPVGDPEDCATWLRELAERTGVTRAVLFIDVSGNPEATVENLTRFAVEVLPTVPNLSPASQ